MGLDTTHGCWHGAYSAFSRWRDKLAEVAGYEFYEDERGRKHPLIDWGNISATIGPELFGRWPAIPVRPDGTPDPLIILLAHSDCEGELLCEHLEPLASRLEELLPLLTDVEDGGHIGSYREKTETFIEGLREAHRLGDNVEFH